MLQFEKNVHNAADHKVIGLIMSLVFYFLSDMTDHIPVLFSDMINHNIQGADFICANTDSQALDRASGSTILNAS